MTPLVLDLPRFVLRDFTGEHRSAFLSYQMDPRYVRLYDFDPQDVRRAEDLFALFLNWQAEEPRTRFQLGIFERDSGELCGSAGLRKSGPGSAVLGIELSPDQWGRYRLALDVAEALIGYGFGMLGLERIEGETASGNRRIERLARRFGARIDSRRPGPEWMRERGWEEVNWVLERSGWVSDERQRVLAGAVRSIS